MFEDRSISIWTYNLETLLGEKLETIMARETANTRMRDFYDIHVLVEQPIDYKVLYDAFMATSRKRNAETATDGLQGFYRRLGVALEDVFDGRIGKSAGLCQTVFRPIPLIEQVRKPLIYKGF